MKGAAPGAGVALLTGAGVAAGEAAGEVAGKEEWVWWRGGSSGRNYRCPPLGISLTLRAMGKDLRHLTTLIHTLKCILAIDGVVVADPFGIKSKGVCKETRVSGLPGLNSPRLTAMGFWPPPLDWDRSPPYFPGPWEGIGT